MTGWVWPRIDRSLALELIDVFEGVDPVELRSEHSQLEHQRAAPVAVGGVRVPAEEVRHVRAGLREVADTHGFPDPLSRSKVADFDRPATRVLHERMGIIPSDAAAEGTWSFLSLIVLPDVAVWRFPGRATERLLGRPRNVFRRLWWRAETIGLDAIDVDGGLGEDELVNIFERTALASHRAVARELALSVSRLPSTLPARSEVMREAAKLLLREDPVIALELLDAEQARERALDAVRRGLIGLDVEPDRSAAVIREVRDLLGESAPDPSRPANPGGARTGSGDPRDRSRSGLRAHLDDPPIPSTAPVPGPSSPSERAFRPVADDGREMDATFEVEAAGDELHVVFHARYGSGFTPRGQTSTTSLPSRSCSAGSVSTRRPSGG